jgi:hypothetical protein
LAGARETAATAQSWTYVRTGRMNRAKAALRCFLEATAATAAKP